VPADSGDRSGPSLLSPGFAPATRLPEEILQALVLAALDMALERRKPNGVIHHSDQGTQYTSIDFGLRCKRAGVQPSMGSVGDAYDNAMCAQLAFQRRTFPAEGVTVSAFWTSDRPRNLLRARPPLLDLSRPWHIHRQPSE
jgi:transposase InsO family protein